MYQRTAVFIFVLSLSVASAFAQIGGTGVYKFLNLSPSARTTALGGNLIAVRDGDLNNAYQNPALLNPKMHNSIVLNTVNYFDDINYGYVAYATRLKKVATLQAGIQYVNYGDFTETTPTGQVTGTTFTARDYAINTGVSIPGEYNITYGANAKFIYSNLAEYKSYGIATDLAATYQDSTNFVAALVVKNIGMQLKSYTENNRENLPFEIQLGVSNRLKYAPFRYTIVAHNLQKFDLSYRDPNDPTRQIDLATGEPVEKKISFADKVGRHLQGGIELLLSENFNIRVGYNHQKRRELAVASRNSTVGFSFGVGIRIKKIQLSYGTAKYHLAGSTHQFSIGINFREFSRSK